MPQIERLDEYDDPRFSGPVLAQHGAFLLDGQPCAFEIVSADTARLTAPRVLEPGELKLLADAFRFYAGHISRFVAPDGRLLLTSPAPRQFEAALDALQPSQFYVSRRKLGAVQRFVSCGEDVVVPVQRGEGGRLVVQDGHTRLYAAHCLGAVRVRAFFPAEGPDEDVALFAREARRRGVESISRLRLLEHDEYVRLWHGYCQRWFEEKKKQL